MAATTGAKVLFAPSVGRLADKAPRVDAARAARAAQACGVGLSCLALPHLADETSWLPLLLAGSAIEAPGAVVTKAPPAKTGRRRSSRATARKATVSLSNAALLGELAAQRSAFVLCASARRPSARRRRGELASRLRRPARRPARPVRSARRRAKRRRPRRPGPPLRPAERRGDHDRGLALLWFTALTPHAPVLLAALADCGAPAGRSRPSRGGSARGRRRRGPLPPAGPAAAECAAGADDHISGSAPGDARRGGA